MANKSVFASIKGRFLPKATAKNAHAAPAYAYSDVHALAQVAVTGTFGGMFYQSPQETHHGECRWNYLITWSRVQVPPSYSAMSLSWMEPFKVVHPPWSP